MECLEIHDLSFTYPECTETVLKNITLNINRGEFVTICGKSGCGKTTLLRLLKPVLAPHGHSDGTIIFNGKLISEYSVDEQASQIGFVFQNPDNGIVTDKVWHELAFGLESLGYPTCEIRTKVSEMASYFGIQNWFHKPVNELSGGQKQILNLASVMVMQPSVLILDEPTSQLDPIAAQDFIKTLEKINRELGTTVILSEHRLEDAIPVSDRVILMDNGHIVADAHPRMIGGILKKTDHEMQCALPVPVRIHCSTEYASECPLDVREGRNWLEHYAESHSIITEIRDDKTAYTSSNAVVELKEIWFRYEIESEDILKGLDLKVYESEIFAIVGGNGAGKSTALSIITNVNVPYRGKVVINGNIVSNRFDPTSYSIAALPQNPQTLFVKKTVCLDLLDALDDFDISKDEKNSIITNVSHMCHLESLLNSHPYDLSGGEQQRAALAKVLLKKPKILLLDEPTKGMDACFKEELADILFDLKQGGTTIIMVSHDIEFCASVADRCAMFFDGIITSEGVPRKFFDGNNFYTTSANRMSRGLIRSAVLTDDVIYACTGSKTEKKSKYTKIYNSDSDNNIIEDNEQKRRLTVPRIISGIIFAVLFAVTSLFGSIKAVPLLSENRDIAGLVSLFFAALSLISFFPQKKLNKMNVCQPAFDYKLSKRTIAAAIIIFLAIPLTIFCGIHFFDDRKYYLISILIIIETMLPFLMMFESRKPKARELVVISTLCAIAVAGRAAFFMLPQFKPVVAIVIVSGICFGGETGFLVGAVTGFVSNMLFGQGPWTPWQMFAFGIIGFLSGVLYKRSVIGKTKISLCVFGFIATFLFYGCIMNFSYVVQSQALPNIQMFATVLVSGLPFDILHSLSTAFFLWFLSEPMVEKLERIKLKYGMIG